MSDTYKTEYIQVDFPQLKKMIVKKRLYIWIDQLEYGVGRWVVLDKREIERLKGDFVNPTFKICVEYHGIYLNKIKEA